MPLGCVYTPTVAKMRMSPPNEQPPWAFARTIDASSVGRELLCLHADGHDEGCKTRKDGASKEGGGRVVG